MSSDKNTPDNIKAYSNIETDTNVLKINES